MLTFPDTDLARDAERQLRQTSPDHLVNHCLRSYAWAVAVADLERVAFDAEVLFVAAALHDLGLVEEFDLGNPFELDGARAAGAFASTGGLEASRVAVVQDAVARHLARDVLVEDGPEAYLLWHGTGIDVSGTRVDDLDPSLVADVLGLLPRQGFQGGFSEMLDQQATTKPHSRASELVSGGLLERLASCPLDRWAPAS